MGFSIHLTFIYILLYGEIWFIIKKQSLNFMYNLLFFEAFPILFNSQHSSSLKNRNIGGMIFDSCNLIFIFYIEVQLVKYLFLLYKIIIVIFSENILYKLVFWSSSWILIFLTCIVWEARNGIFQQIQVKKRFWSKGSPLSMHTHALIIIKVIVYFLW